MKTVAIVEDSREYQNALLSLIENAEGFVVADVYDNAEDAMNMLNNPADIAIVDIQLPGISGIELIKRLTEKSVSTSFLVCSINDDDESVFDALKNGASGYILKESSSDQIVNALNDVFHGGAPMSPYIAKRVIKSFQNKQERQRDVLTDRETEVLKLLSTGLQYKEIGNELNVSYETVKKHLKHIYEKLHVQNKVEAINKFRAR
ncbi:response regulator [Segetibacter sp. 3557_3]|uniref:response regulator n=1 Tax=Segetibacter sp. 3557_3 TaxID=2547429 RepID=UPI0014042BD2|nr:response regulator transcription factor [Segetibacter sp. 3557_3]